MKPAQISELIACLSQSISVNMKGFLVSAMVALAAKFLSEHYGAPAMLLALLLGLAMNFLSDDPRTHFGVQFSARTVLRLGVALLGVRVSWDVLRDLGPGIIGCVILAVFCTIVFGVLLAKLVGRHSDFGLLTGGSVAICGASAAMAIAAILPPRENDDRDLTFAVLGITILSTLAMILFPVLANMLGLDTQAAGIFLGGSIHDVAQVVGAGFSISEETGEIAVLIKLIRVSMLAPVVLVLALRVRSANVTSDSPRPPLLPSFLIGFAVLVFLNSLGWVPDGVRSTLTTLSGWALLIAISAVGIKTSARSIVSVGGSAITMIVAETIFLGTLIIGAVLLTRG